MNTELQQKWQDDLDNLIHETHWQKYDDHYSSMQYCPALLKELQTGVTASVQQEIIAEIISRIYEQDKLSTGIHVVLRPLLLLCLLERIEFKKEVMEFILEIQQRYLYLKGIIGTQPQKYAYIGEMYGNDTEAGKAMMQFERPYYDLIKANRSLVIALAHTKDLSVQNLAIKCYGLSAVKTNPEETTIPVKPLEQHLQDKDTNFNTLATVGFIAQLTNEPGLMNKYCNDVDPLYREICKGLAGIRNIDLPVGLIETRLTPDQFPWYEGNVGLLAIAACINSRKSDLTIIDIGIRAINKMKSIRSSSVEWQPHEIIAEWMALSYFGELIPAAHKRPINELNSSQIAVLKKLSAHSIITHTQILAGLPDTISGLNQYLYQATANKEFQ